MSEQHKHDTGDERDVARQRQELLVDVRQQDADMRMLLSQPAGRRVFFRLMFDPTLGAIFDDLADMPEPRAALGQQRVGLRLKDWCERAQPGAFLMIMAEASDGETP